MSKIFQIGFNKCGTKSICFFLRANGIPAVHWDEGRLAISIRNSLNSGVKLLTGYEQFTGFTDMQSSTWKEPYEKIRFHAYLLFRELDQQYPGSKFILNTRSKEKWLLSRSRHDKGRYILDSQKAHGLNKKRVLVYWSKCWDEHHANVIEYFKNRPDDLLIFNIEKDHPQKLCDFLSADWPELDPKHWKNIKIGPFKHK